MEIITTVKSSSCALSVPQDKVLKYALDATPIAITKQLRWTRGSFQKHDESTSQSNPFKRNDEIKDPKELAHKLPIQASRL
ncbi:uncharacterized protein PHALS_04072 [Plasmopara halstedii]|uniref:Uncharacterized protein n=1 Tax=Plasmopara halstedii TaxID=4781 RepID=A0A0P1A814_PLAHL|nr:uncharacterized protein PHALS_04072 [Plasmopara halstedii]CEG36815.1 hypothetical protein PHALS_04072 [Plasmopara halstedii]|eukprot:XP_024573184.1 hypothetical protein PHALS_04072 [Plasmopara halstedii]